MTHLATNLDIYKSKSCIFSTWMLGTRSKIQPSATQASTILHPVSCAVEHRGPGTCMMMQWVNNHRQQLACVCSIRWHLARPWWCNSSKQTEPYTEIEWCAFKQKRKQDGGLLTTGPMEGCLEEATLGCTATKNEIKYHFLYFQSVLV